MFYLESHFNEINVAQNFDPLSNSLYTLFESLSIQFAQDISDIPTRLSKCCVRLTCYSSSTAYFALLLTNDYSMSDY